MAKDSCCLYQIPLSCDAMYLCGSNIYIRFLLLLSFFRHLGSQLSEMRNVIERMMEADFVDFAVANLNITTKRSDEVYEEV